MTTILLIQLTKISAFVRRVLSGSNSSALCRAIETKDDDSSASFIMTTIVLMDCLMQRLGEGIAK
jgi:hypothetical protein